MGKKEMSEMKTKKEVNKFWKELSGEEIVEVTSHFLEQVRMFVERVLLSASKESCFYRIGEETLRYIDLPDN